MVGITTPVVLLKNDRIDEMNAMIGAAVAGVIIASSASEIRSMPPISITTFIKTPTPQIRSRVPQGILARACFSLATPRRISTAATKKEVRPTSRRRNMTR